MNDPSGVQVTGPLAPFADGFRAELSELGYSPGGAVTQLRLMAALSRWLAAAGLEAVDLTPARLELFLGSGPGNPRTRLRSKRGVSRLVGYLRRVGVVAPEVPVAPSTAVERLLEDYRGYLVCERGVTKDTVRHYLGVAEVFLSACEAGGPFDLGRLSGVEVTAFVVSSCRQDRAKSAKNLVTGLRSLLRYLYSQGLTARELAPAVPTAAGWSGASLPRALEPGEVATLVASCDPATTTGRRDHAILVVLARLGLRAGEVAALELDDVDWQHGEILVRGKGDRRERLPLPVDVGDALVAYLRDPRPPGAPRNVFLRSTAPIGALSSAGVAGVVRRSCPRCSIPSTGPHRLRHSAATAMLRAGASLDEVGQVLRHTSVASTSIYAKVDRASLRPLARRWPGGAA